MAAIAEIVAGAIQGIGNTGISIYNAWSQARNNRLQREREDNAVQRRVRDLERAGLSPTLAAGSAAAASPTTAPQMDKTDIFDRILAARQASADYSTTMANKRYVDEQLKYLRSQKKEQDIKNSILQHDADIYLKTPFTSKNNSPVTGALRDLVGVAGWENLDPLNSPFSPIGLSKLLYGSGKSLIETYGGDVANTTKEKLENAQKESKKIVKEAKDKVVEKARESIPGKAGRGLRNLGKYLKSKIKG